MAEGKIMAAWQVPRPQVAPLVAKWIDRYHRLDTTEDKTNRRCSAIGVYFHDQFNQIYSHFS